MKEIPAYDDAYWQEIFDERAAVMEYCGCTTRKEAERYAARYVAWRKKQMEMENAT